MTPARAGSSDGRAAGGGSGEGSAADPNDGAANASGAPTGLARVLLVEDDPAVARFVALALDDLPVELVVREHVRGALEALAEAPVALLLTDLMLPGDPGLALLDRTAADPALRAGARLAVFSAGVAPPVRARLAALGVDEVLHKPASLAALRALVQSALAPAGAPAKATDPADLDPPPGAPAGDGSARAVSRHFDGDAVLYAAYRERAVPLLLAELDTACDARDRGDVPGLRRLAHSLKGGLLLLGFDALAERAAAIEHDAAEGRLAEAAWPAFATAVRQALQSAE